VKLRHILFNRVKSDTGFVVKIRHMEGFAEYREGDKIAVVTVDPVVGQPLSIVHKDEDIKWNPPHHAEVITEEKRKQILQNVVDAMRFRRFRVELV
jgi:hypothetical protein